MNMDQQELKDRNDSKLTRATFPLIFVDGSQVLCSTLGHRSNVSLNNWVKARYLHDQRSHIPEDATEEEKDRIERIAQQTASTLCWYLGLGAQIMICVEGMAQILYEAAKVNHPDLQVEELIEKLFDERNMDRANETIAKFENLDVDLKKSQ